MVKKFRKVVKYNTTDKRIAKVIFICVGIFWFGYLCGSRLDSVIGWFCVGLTALYIIAGISLSSTGEVYWEEIKEKR